MTTYFVSDTHFGYKNILRFDRRPWDHIFVMRDVWDCADKPLRDRMIYTATSRPAKSLHLGVWA
jgi:hypothetical protein